MYMIKTAKGYVTRQGFEADYSFTQNKNFTYVFEELTHVEAVIKHLGIIAEIIELIARRKKGLHI